MRQPFAASNFIALRFIRLPTKSVTQEEAFVLLEHGHDYRFVDPKRKEKV